MKKLITLITLTPLFALMVSTVALATPIIFEPFDYPYVPGYLTTNLVGHSTVDGNAWVQAGGGLTNIPGIVPGNLSVTGLAPSYGNSCHFGGVAITNGMAARLNLPNNITHGSLYYSFIVKITDITGLSTVTNTTATNGVFWAGFNNTAGSQSGVPTIIFGAVNWRTNAAGGYQIGINKRGGDTNNIAWDPNPHQPGDQLFIVGTYDYLDGGPGAGSADTSRMWINPDPSTFEINPEPTGGTVPSGAPLVSTGAADVSTGNGGIQSFCLLNRNAGEPHGITVDELMIGTSWADVTLTNVPLALNSQPKNARSLVGGKVSFSATTLNASIYQWQHNDVDIPSPIGTQRVLTLTNVQSSDAGSYRLKISNGGAGPLTSSEATLTIYPDIYPRLVPLWSLAPGSRPYLTTDSSQQPNQRCFAYNSFSNQVLLVSRTNTTLPSAFYTNNIWVLNGDTGADLYQMNADPAVVFGGLDLTGGSTNILALNGIDVGSDAAVFACNVGNAGTGAAQFKLYRWPTSDPNGEPVNVWIGDPSGQSSVPRFGDSLAVRGSGNAVEVMLDSQSGTAGSLLNVNPGGSVLDNTAWAYHYFTNQAGGQVGGRTLLYYGTDNTFWEKGGGSGSGSGGNLVLMSYDTAAQTSAIITNIPDVLSSPNLVAFTAATNILVALDRVADGSTVPDTLDQYDLVDPSNPLFIRSYNFPVNHQPNANGCGRVVVSGDRVYALDSNNGMVAFRLEPVLSISQTDSTHVQLAWSATTPGYTLYSTHDLTTPLGSWTSVGTGTQSGQQFVLPDTIGSQPTFYRLQKP